MPTTSSLDESPSPREGRVVVCESDLQSLRALRFVLRGAGFGVATTASPEETLDRIALLRPDAAMVELVLPDAGAIEICRRLREWSELPVIVLSVVDEEEQKVRALEAGADDYVTKPFAPSELVARLRAVLRRAQPQAGQPRLEAGNLTIDLAARVVLREGAEVHLTPIEYKLLRVLIQDRGRLVPHDELLRQAWGGAYWGGAYPYDRRALRTHIANLRRKIDPGGRLGLIHTLNGSGYRFVDRGRSPGPRLLAARPGLPARRLSPVASQRDAGGIGASIARR